MAEFNQMTITQAAKETADRFVSEGWFKSANQVGVFAAAYVIKHHFNEVDPSCLNYSGDHNYGYSSFDPDGTWENLMKNLYCTDSPRLYFRNLIIWGLERMGEEIKKTGSIKIIDFI